MSLTYPLTLPATPGFVDMKFMPRTVVGFHESPYTLQGQTFVWPGQGWAVSAALPKMKVATAAAWVAWKLGLNGRQGTFYLTDQSYPTTRGTASGTQQCDSGNTANSTTLIIVPLTGAFVVGDWLQIGNNLHRVVQVNSAVSYDVFPRLRTAYAAGTAITYTAAKGLFRLASNEGMGWDVNTALHYGLTLEATEALT